MTIVAMLGLFYISTFLDLSDKWFKGQTTFGQILAFLWWSTPQFMAYIIALAVLLAALVTIGVLTKNSELIVMRACGVSLYRTAAPMLAFALVASAILFGMEERVLAFANRRADQLKHLIRGGSAQTFDVLNRKWIVGPRRRGLPLPVLQSRARRELNGLSVFEFDPKTHALTRRVYAQRALYQPGTEGPEWQLTAGWTRKFGDKTPSPSFESFAERMVGLETADYFVTEVPEPRRMNYPQLSRYIAELRQSGYDVLEHEVELYRKVAFPFVTLVMTFIAVPFAVTTGRRGAMYGIGVGIVLALVYWTMISVFAAFGAGGVDQPAAGRLGSQSAVRRGSRLPAPDGAHVTMATVPESKSLAPRPSSAGLAVSASLVVIPIGMVLLVTVLGRRRWPDGRWGGRWVCSIVGGALLALGIATLIWEMSERYDHPAVSVVALKVAHAPARVR